MGRGLGRGSNTGEGEARMRRKTHEPCDSFSPNTTWLNGQPRDSRHLLTNKVPCSACGWSRYTHEIASYAFEDTKQRRAKHGNGSRLKKRR